jgi:hypothetical protein
MIYYIPVKMRVDTDKKLISLVLESVIEGTDRLWNNTPELEGRHRPILIDNELIWASPVYSEYKEEKYEYY